MVKTKNYKKKTNKNYMSTKRSYKKKFNRNKRPNGYKLKNNILSSSASRILEFTYPIYLNSTDAAGAATQTGGFAARYSFNPGVAAMLYQVDAFSNIANANINQSVYSREFINMAKVYSMFRVKGVSVCYNRTLHESDQGIQNAGPMALYVTPSDDRATGADLLQYTANWCYDNTLKFNPLQMTYKSKYYGFPNRPVSSAAGPAVNSWIPTNQGSASARLFIRLGGPPEVVGVPISQVNANGISSMLGTVTLRVNCEFSVPQTTNIN